MEEKQDYTEAEIEEAKQWLFALHKVNCNNVYCSCKNEE